MKEVTAAMAMTLIEIKDLKKQLGITTHTLVLYNVQQWVTSWIFV